MRYRIAYNSKKDSCRVYIVSSVREAGSKSPRTIIHKACGKRSQLLESDPNATHKIQAEADRLNKESAAKINNLALLSVDNFFKETKNTPVTLPFI